MRSDGDASVRWHTKVERGGVERASSVVEQADAGGQKALTPSSMTGKSKGKGKGKSSAYGAG
jgi:hypothetical protein